MRSVAIVYALLVSTLLLNGCTATIATHASRQSERGVLLCSGSGAFVHCRRVAAAKYEETLRGLQRPVTGSRIAR